MKFRIVKNTPEPEEDLDVWLQGDPDRVVLWMRKGNDEFPVLTVQANGRMSRYPIPDVGLLRTFDRCIAMPGDKLR